MPDDKDPDTSEAERAEELARQARELSELAMKTGHAVAAALLTMAASNLDENTG